MSEHEAALRDHIRDLERELSGMQRVIRQYLYARRDDVQVLSDATRDEYDKALTRLRAVSAMPPGEDA